MSDDSPVLETLKRLRQRYGATMTDNECATLMNDTAWAHRTEGYGVSNKDGGTHGHRAGDGEDICHDVLMLKDGTYWDALLQAGGASIPNFDPDKPSGKITDSTRYWIAPIPPLVVPPTPTYPPPPPVPETKPREQWAAEFAEVNAFYTAPEGLQRPGGMVLNGMADIQAMIQWGYDLLGVDVTVNKIFEAIRSSHEWKTKHPNGV